MQRVPEKAMILAAGLGTRMRPLTDQMPKPLLSVGGKPLIDHMIDLMQEAGINEIVVNTHYLPEKMQAHLAGREVPGIVVSHEETLLETGGGLVNALPLLGDAPFVSANSDVILCSAARNPLQRLAEHWRDDMRALLLLQPVENAIGYRGAGDFYLTDEGGCRRRGDAVNAPYVFTGVQMIHPRLLQGFNPEPFSLNLAYDKYRLPDGTLDGVYGMVHDGDWLHTGDPEAFALAENYFSSQWKRDTA